MKTELPISLQGYQELMPFHVQEILLVSSLYDAFILQEDGRLDELILGEFLELNLRSMPKLTHVATGEEALRLARDQRICRWESIEWIVRARQLPLLL